MVRPTVIDRGTAGPAYPRYERLALRLIGVNEFVWLASPAIRARPLRREAARPSLIDVKLPTVDGGVRRTHAGDNMR